MHTGATVFVVDDDPGVRKSLRWLIESIGLNVEAYASAREFLDTYNHCQPGCAVLDVRMPVMSGIEAMESLRAQGATIPIIVITGYGDVTTAVRAMKNGAVDFIEKPFNDQVLLDCIQQCIDRDSRNRETTALPDPYRTGSPGKPTIKHLILAEFRRRVRAGDALPVLTDEAKALSDWAARKHPAAPTPTARTIENQIRDEYRRAVRRKPTK